MGFRTVRTAAAASPLLLLPLLAAACGGGNANGMQQATTDTVVALPDDTTRLTAEQLASLPRYGAQRLPCSDVQSYLELTAQGRQTRVVNIRVSGGRLGVRPGVGEAARGDTILWRTDDNLSWLVRFKEGISPLRDGRETVRGQGEVPAAVTEDSTGCGRYVYHVAAYDTESDSLYIADPVWWVY